MNHRIGKIYAQPVGCQASHNEERNDDRCLSVSSHRLLMRWEFTASRLLSSDGERSPAAAHDRKICQLVQRVLDGLTYLRSRPIRSLAPYTTVSPTYSDSIPPTRR